MHGKVLAGIKRRTKEEATTTITVMMVHDDTADTCANGASVLHQNVSWMSLIEMDLQTLFLYPILYEMFVVRLSA